MTNDQGVTSYTTDPSRANSSVLPYYRDGFEWFRQRAEKGNAWAQWALARHYRSGDGVPEDQAIAFDWFGKAAGQGNAPAQLEHRVGLRRRAVIQRRRCGLAIADTCGISGGEPGADDPQG